MKNYWMKILKENLIRHPAYFSNDKLYKHEHRDEFITPENLIVIIKTKVRRHGFGGPVYSAVVKFYKEEARVTFVPPKYKDTQEYKIKWAKILEMDLCFLPEVSRRSVRKNKRTSTNSKWLAKLLSKGRDE